jgi:hypothetical protein
VKPQPNSGGLSVLEGVVLDMVAEGKSPRAIAETLGIKPAEAAKMAYDLLDSEIVTDTEQRRKLQVYRLEKIVEALWSRTMKQAEKDDVRNLVDVLDKLNTLLALNKEQDAEMMTRMHSHQLATYLSALMGLLSAFKMLAPDLMSEEQWAEWGAERMEIAQKQMTLEITEG